MPRRTVASILTSLALGAVALPVAAVVTAAPAFAVDPVAGGQSASPPDTLTPNQGNSGYDVGHYDINLRADFTPSQTANAVGTSTVSSTTTISASTTGAPLSSYSLDFQGSTGNLAAATYNVDSVTVNGVPATFTRIESSSTTSALVDNHKLIITPATPVSGAFSTVVVASGSPVIHFDTDGSAEGWNNTTDGATFVNQPVGSMTLFPNNNTPRDKATYTWTVDVPSMLKTSNYANAGGKPYPSAVAGNGELVSKTPNGDGSRTTWVWDETKPMASELSMVSIGRYDVYESDITLASGRTIHEWSFIDPAISTQNQNTTQVSRSQFKALLDFYESRYGPYPGNSTGVVTDVVPSTINYALETQDRPFFPNSAGGSFYHEIMHQWWGDNVTPWDWNDITLNEGPATYAPPQFAFESSGTSTTTTEQSLYNTWNTTASNSNPTFTVAPAAMTAVNQLFGSQVYNKGAMTLEALRTAIGAGNFETLMRQYQLTYGGGQITGRRTAAFQAMAESISGRDLTAFFQAWWYAAGKPAWPVKFNLNVAGPTGVLGAGSAAAYTLSVRNTGKVAMPAPGTTVTFDVSDLVDDATLGTLPAGVTQDGTTLTWAVPATALATTSSVTLPFTVNAAEGNGTLKGVARAATLGSTCVDCTATNVLGRSPISPAVTAIGAGTPTFGVPLTADTSGWAAGTTFTYQWLVDGTPVAGATGASWTPTIESVGLPVTLQVTGKQAGLNTTSSTSPPSANVVRATQTPGTNPTISGTPKIGSRLTLDRGTWEPGTVFTYQWRANGANISAANGGTGTSFTPNNATQVGQTIDVVVSGTKAGYTTLTKTVALTAPVAAGDPLASTPTPTFSGTPRVGVPFAPTYGAWDDGTALTFQWAANGINITSGGTGGSFTPTAAQVGQTLTVTVTGTKPGIPAVVRTSTASDAVVAGTQTLQPTPSITGNPRALTASTGVPGTWDTGTTLTHKWYADGVAIPGAITTSYTPTTLQIGQTLTYEVTSTRAGYTTVTKTSAGKVILGLAQTLTPTPTISGPETVGGTLAGDPGTWDSGTTLTYQWFSDGNAIAGATGTEYVLTPAELGTKLTFAVTSTRATYETVTKTSAPTGSIGNGALTSTPTPTIDGTPQVDVPLTAQTGTWDGGVTFAYQWTVDGTDVAGATASTFTPTAGDAGEVVTVKVTGSKPGFSSVTKESAPTAAVAVGDLVATPVPTISGTPKVDVQLQAAHGTWDAGVSFAYQWTVGGTDVAGATASTYTPVPADAGKVVTVKVTGSKAGYASVTKESVATAAVADGDLVLTPTPTITGTAKVDVQLQAAHGTWDPGVSFGYQWTVDGADVVGATASTFTPGASAAGKVVTVEVTGSKTGYVSVTRESAATAAVADGDQVSTPKPTITGTPKAGVLLSAVTGSWDAGVALTYQWRVDGADVPGATASSYAPSASAVGKTVTVKVTGTKAGYVTVTQESDPVGPVVNGTQGSTPTPTIAGTPKVGVGLSVSSGLWDDGAVLTYQWTVDGADVPGATGVAFTPAAGDVGKVVTVKVTGTRSGFDPVTKESAPTAPVALGDLTATPKPTMTGTPQVAMTLTAVPGTWDAGVTLGYQWTVAGADVAGATSSTYTPVAGDTGKVVTVKVTGTKAGYTPVTKESDPSPAVTNGTQTLTPTPTVAGTAKVGQTLTATAGSWDSGVSLAYQWTADGANIAGATASSYTAVAGDVGKVLTVKVTGTKVGYAPVTKESAQTSAVVRGDLAMTPVPTVTGTPRFGETLTADPGTWDSGTTLTYQWLADGSPVSGATSSTYVIGADQVGKSLAVAVGGSKPGYQPVTRISLGTSGVAARSLGADECTLAINGKAKVGKKLSIKLSACPAGATVRYSWYVGSKLVKGANGSTLKLKRSYAGKKIGVLVSVTVPGYEAALRQGKTGAVKNAR